MAKAKKSPSTRLATPSTSFVTIAGVRLEVRRLGRGKPLLMLSSEEMLEPDHAFVADLAGRFEIIIPSPPGFGRSERPDWITGVDDVSYLYLSLIEKLGLKAVTLVGFSLGGWIAAEMAVKDDARLARMMLVAPYGVKFGGVLDRDIADLWWLAPEKVAALKWYDPVNGHRDVAALSDDALTEIARNAESFARLCWEPFMHDPKLAHRLDRIAVPTTLVWGANDGILPPDYGRNYRKLIPGARLKIIQKAGHLPHLERPQAFLAHFQEFATRS
ncbi:MAG TPA: alpha/beta hydrolase [Stellaceae bacterium]|nr:alpha/beta hydrolase [Stellaceae bacterium]